MELQFEQNDVDEKIYFLNNVQNNINEVLKKLNDSNAKLSINNKKYNFQKYFIPTENVTEMSNMFRNCGKLKYAWVLLLILKM